MTTEATLTKIFSQAGEIISSHIVEEGVSPNKNFTCVWNHKNGFVQFDGKDWEYTPWEKAE